MSKPRAAMTEVLFLVPKSGAYLLNEEGERVSRESLLEIVGVIIEQHQGMWFTLGGCLQNVADIRDDVHYMYKKNPLVWKHSRSVRFERFRLLVPQGALEDCVNQLILLHYVCIESVNGKAVYSRCDASLKKCSQ